MSRTLLLHAVAFGLLGIIWFSGACIKTAVGTPFVAVFYVAHIFSASILCLWILFEWFVKNPIALKALSLHQRINLRFHRLYYQTLLILPITGLVIFFDASAWRWSYELHVFLFDVLMVLIVLNALYFAIQRLRQ